MHVLIRNVVRTDFPTLGAVHYRARMWAYESFLPAPTLAEMRADSLASWWRERVRYEAKSHRMRVAQVQARVVGFAYCGASELDDKTGELYALHVDPPSHRRGIGRALITDALAVLRKAGYVRAVLWVLDGNDNARTFYENQGWLSDGTVRADMIGSAETTQVRYTKPL